MRLRGALTVLATALLSVVPESMHFAVADPYPNGGIHPDRGTHTYCFEPLASPGPAVRDRVHYSMDNNDGVEAQTAVSTQFYASCSTAIDVRVAQADLGDQIWGGVACQYLNDNGFCDQYLLVVNWAEIQRHAPQNAGYGARHTICHEIGHTLGAAHYFGATGSPDGSTQSCLRSGLLDSGAASWRTYGPHHRSHINAWFTSL